MVNLLQSGRGQQGFTYLGLMLFIAIAGLGLGVTGTLWQKEIQREKERELLFIGEQYRQAIKSYYENTPSGIKQFPLKLEDMLKDARFPETKRHLRKLYPNPLDPAQPWSLLREQGRIIGVYADSGKVPLQKVFKEEGKRGFSDAKAYRDWQFLYMVTHEIPVNVPLAVPIVPLGSPTNLVPPKPVKQNPDDPCDGLAKTDYPICQGVCFKDTLKACNACYASLRERLYACRRNQPLPPLVIKSP